MQIFVQVFAKDSYNCCTGVSNGLFLGLGRDFVLVCFVALLCLGGIFVSPVFNESSELVATDPIVSTVLFCGRF